ncbi:MAG: fibronectin type III domain-containing protein [Solirubrobacterales bacterium]
MRFATSPTTKTRRRAATRIAVTALTLMISLIIFSALAGSVGAAPASSSWIRISTTAQGQLLSKLQAKLVSDYGQTAGSYDYSVVKKLRISGTLNAQDYTDLRSGSYAGTSIQKLDLSGIVDTSTNVLNGMTALTDVNLPPVASFTLANPFNGDANLKNVVVAAETYAFGSTTTFNGATSLQRITFLHPTKPNSTNLTEASFAGSSNSNTASRAVTAVVPNATRGDYDKTAFTQYFSGVTDAASSDDRDELQVIIDEASAIDHSAAAAEYRWTLLQQAITSATNVRTDSSATAAQLYRARLVLQTAIDKIGSADVGLSLKVTHGAAVTLGWKNGTAQHYAEFVEHPVAKVASLSDDSWDVYVPTVPLPYVSQNVATAVIHGQTDKVAKIFTMSAAAVTANTQYTLALASLADRTDTALLIPGLAAGDNRGLYTNLDDTGVINLNVGEHFDLDTYRTQQAQLDQVNNLFIEPDYTFDVSGDSVSTQNIGFDGRRQLRINATQPGLSVVKITYGPLHYLTASDNGTPGTTNWSFNGIDPQNTGLAVINVAGNNGTFNSGINVKNELDTYYFDKAVGSRDFSFTPDPGTTVRVHDPLNVSSWGSGWHSYSAAPDGSFTVKLKAGRNIVELTNDGKVEYRVLRAKGVDVSIANSTRPGEPLFIGDTAQVSITGIEGGIEKLGGIYNPAFNAGTKGKLTYYDGASQIVSNEASQYQTAITTFKVNYTLTGASDRGLGGDMFIGGLGAEWPYHRIIPQEGKPANLAAVAIGPYHFGGLPPLYVYGNNLSTTPGPVGAPSDLQAVHGDGSAAISWTAPSSTGGRTIRGYTVRYSSDEGDSWQTKTIAPGTGTSLTGLSNGTEYEVQVAAMSSDSLGDYSESETVTPSTTPGAPSGVQLTPHYTSIHASWTAPTGDGGSPITGYRVRYSDDDGENWTTVSPDFGVVTSTDLTGLTNDTEYEVQVAAINGDGVGDFSDVATATPFKTPATLGTPAVQNLTRTSATIQTDVDPGDIDQDVTVEYTTNSDHAGAVSAPATSVIGGSGETSVPIALSALTLNTTYYYRVVATASDSDVVASDWNSFTTDKVAATVGAPSVADITQTTAKVSSEVSAGDLAQSVKVEYTTQSDHSNAASSAATSVAAGAPSGPVEIALSGLVSNTTYYYRAVATASDSDVIASGWSSFKTAKVAATVATPSTSDITQQAAKVAATVSAGDLAQSVKVEYSANANHSGAASSSATAVAAGSPAGPVVTALSGLNSNTTYYYRVVATASDSDVVASDWSSFKTTKVAATVAAPSVSNLQQSAAKISGVVTAGDLAQSVTVEYTTHFDHTLVTTSLGVSLASGGSATIEIPLGNLSSNTTYYYRVVATASDSDAVASDWNSFKTAKLPATVGAPSVSDVTKSSVSISALVTAGDLAQSVTVEYSGHADHTDAVSSSATAVPAGTAGATVSTALTGLTSNTTYYFRVVATASDSGVVSSSWDSFTTGKSAASVAAPTASAIAVKSASISAVVTPGDLAQDVSVQYTANADHSGTVSSPTTTIAGGSGASTVTIALSGLEPATEYHYRVALLATDYDRIYSDWATFTTAAIDAPTLSLTTGAADVRVGDVIRISWTATGADTLIAGGDWTGLKTGTGFENIVAARTGNLTFTLSATGEGGTTTSSVAVNVTPAPVTLGPKKLTVKVKKSKLRRGATQRVSATGLAAGEQATLVYRGKKIAVLTASSTGSVIKSFKVGSSTGTKTVEVVGASADRSGSKRFTVVK